MKEQHKSQSENSENELATQGRILKIEDKISETKTF